MFKRRLAVLGAVAVLAVTGLAGSALADDAAPAPAGAVTCTTADGKTVTLAEAKPAGKIGKIIARDGIKAVKRGDTVEIQALGPEDAPKAPEAALAVPAEPAQPVTPGGEPAEMLPAEPGKAGTVHVKPGEEARVYGEAPVDGPEGFARTMKIICKKAD
ncbi:hypothetical protein GBF35_00725 [Nonomuraea phyllanthi]|uniref:hypothetical protein n=1 Tax=Nonomuraea phyllanthi TaxID=2219224 RepID=UPI0012940DFD|nr:hypothetical protein [Nonomuraea phyllanthi]QFY05402.1 hypothetical protein GBF35_00725 [Nonomuraea phyllanthi]